MLDMAKRAGLPWDAILGAELAQAYKPDPKPICAPLDILAMQPEEVCMVAAHNGDLAAARACGLATAFVPRPNEHGPGQTSGPAAGAGLGRCRDAISASWRTSSAPDVAFYERAARHGK